MAVYNFNTQKVTPIKLVIDGKKNPELSHEQKMTLIKQASAKLKKGK